MNESPSAIASFHDAVAALLRDTAERVVMPRYCALAEHEIEEKAADDFVTVADRDKLSIGFGGVWAAREGQPLAGYDEAPVAAHLKGREIAIEIDLGLGDGRATVWTCDLTHGYIAINADYRS